MGLPGGSGVKASPSNAGHVGSIPGGGARIPLAPLAKNKKQKQYCNEFNGDFKTAHIKETFEKKKTC